MWPPSSCPAGRRLIAVTKRPTHPAKARGCLRTGFGRGKNRERKLKSREPWIASPGTVGTTGGVPVERARPASVPSGGNEGRKNGSEAWTLYFLATRKWPISWEPRIVRSGREKNRLP